MECACLANNGPAFTPQPHMIPGYMGYVPQFKYKFGNTYAEQTRRLFLDPCVSMSPKTVLTDICPEDCSMGGFMQRATGFRYGQCGCNSDPCECSREPQYTYGRNRGQGTQVPRFQTIMNHDYAPYCNRFSTKTFEQDQWRDNLLMREKKAMDGWRYCFKSKPWERPERTKPWDGDNSEFRRTQVTMQAPLNKDDIDTYLRGFDGVSENGGPCQPPPYPADSLMYREVKNGRGSCANPTGAPGKVIEDDDEVPITGYTPDGLPCGPRVRRKKVRKCPPCDLYQRQYKEVYKTARDAGLKECVKHPFFPCPQGNLFRTELCEELMRLKEYTKDEMSKEYNCATEGVVEELGELPILTLHKISQKKEDQSGKFYPEERGLARVCNPVGSSYLTARPWRCHPIYKVCEPMISGYDGHIPGKDFMVGENRGRSTRNALKHMTYRI